MDNSPHRKPYFKSGLTWDDVWVCLPHGDGPITLTQKLAVDLITTDIRLSRTQEVVVALADFIKDAGMKIPVHPSPDDYVDWIDEARRRVG